MRIVVLASGNGSNAGALMHAAAGGRIDGAVVGVVSDTPGAGVLARAAAAQVSHIVVPRDSGEERRVYDTRLAAVVRDLAPDLVVLAGWMRILTEAFIREVGAPVVNLHPALPGDLPGTGSIERAWHERLSGRRGSGVMVHLVPDEGVDNGPVLGSVTVPLAPGDTLEQFTDRMHAAEHELLVAVVADISHGRLVAGEGASA